MSRLAFSLILIAMSVAIGCAGLRPLHQKTIDEAIRHLEKSPSTDKNRVTQSDANKPKQLEQEKPLVPASLSSPMPKELTVASSDPIKIPRAIPAQGGIKTVSGPASTEPLATPIPVETAAMTPTKPEVRPPLPIEPNEVNMYTLDKSIRPAMPTVTPQESADADNATLPPSHSTPIPRPALRAVAESSALLNPPAMPSSMAETSKKSASPPEEDLEEPSPEAPPAPRTVVVESRTPLAKPMSATTDETEVVIDEESIDKPMLSKQTHDAPAASMMVIESRHPAPVEAVARAAEHMDRTIPIQQPSRAEQREPLRLDRMHFCTEIMGFGQTEPVERNEFKPDQRLMLYVEVQNFSIRPEGRLFETSLTSQVIVTNKEGQLVFTHQFEKIVDRCHERRHEFFCHYVFDLPESLAAGDYKVTLLIYDEQSHQTAAQSIDLLVNPSSVRE